VNSPEGTFGLESFTGNQMNWEGVDYDPTYGGGILIQHALSSCSRIELRGSWLGQVDASARTTGQFAFAPPIPGIAANNSMIVESEAEVITGELNWVRQLGGCRTRYDLGLGLRATYFEETASANNFATAFNPGFPGAPFVTSTVEEYFIGAQLVTGVHHDVNRCLELSAMFKPALGNLNRNLTVNDNSIFAGGAHTSRSEEDELVFAFEVELSAKWRLNRCIALVAGYRLLFVDDIVRANDAMDFTKSFSGAVQAAHTTDQLFVHTLFAGVNLSF
jgi:hypothetical protein